MQKYKIADVIIEYDYFHKDFFAPRLREYEYYGEEKPQMSFSYKVCDKINEPKIKTSRVIDNWTIGTLESGDLFSMVKSKSGRIILLNENSPDYSVNKSYILSMKPAGDLDDCDREYLRGSATFNNYLICHKGTTLHSSAIAYKGEAVLFSAPSGTGKSTHTALWEKLFPDDIEYINDDKPAITKKDGKFMASGTVWSGKTALNQNKTCSIKAIVFLARGEINKMKRLDTATAVCYLTDQTFPSFYDERLFALNIDIIEDIIKTVPVYLLECNMDDEAAKLAKNTIFNSEEKE